MDTTKQGMVVGRVEFGASKAGPPSYIDKCCDLLRCKILLAEIVEAWSEQGGMHEGGINDKIEAAREFLAQKT